MILNQRALWFLWLVYVTRKLPPVRRVRQASRDRFDALYDTWVSPVRTAIFYARHPLLFVRVQVLTFRVVHFGYQPPHRRYM